MKTKLPIWLMDLLISFFMALGLGAVLAAFSIGAFLHSWLVFGFLLLVSIFILLRTWHYFGSSRSLAILIAVTFFIRLIVAVIVSAGLPVWGYDNPVNNAGYLYSDAYNRDQAAFKLAGGTQPLTAAFTNPDKSDQYGGLLFLSAAVYRAFSPDADRSLLISLLAAFAMALGLAFFWGAVQKRWSLHVAVIASWVIALFPDSVLLGSSQMREPFLIALACIAFWAMLVWKTAPLRSIIVSLVTLIFACLLSLPAGGIFIAILATTFILEWSLGQTRSVLRFMGLSVLALFFLGAIAAGWMWLRSTLYFDSYRSMMQSGWIQDLMRTYGDRWMIPFTSVYGLMQPVLPAALVDPAQPIWQTIAIFRALGWFVILPFLFFGFFSVWKTKPTDSKWLLMLLNLVFLFWVMIASMRAGGDQWDNPRYRYMLLPFMAILIAWSFELFQKTHSPWLWRWVAVFGEFFLFFMNFYINRYVNIGTNIPLFKMIALIIGIAVIILAGGLVWDSAKRKSKKLPNNHG